MADRIVLGRPEPSECNEYYFLYIDRVPTGDVLGLLEQQLESTAGFLLGLEPGRLDYRYAPGKWSVKEVVGHVIDVERTFSYRAMCGARNEPADLPSFEQEAYVENSRYGVRPIEDIVREYRTTRAATLALFDSFDEDEWMRPVKACGMDFITRVFPFILAGHEIHHLGVIEEKYLIGAN